MKNIVLLILIICFINVLIPINVYSHKNTTQPDLASESAIVIDEKSGDILFEKNSKQEMYPASLTKIATAIYAIENGDLEELVTVSENARNTEGSRVYLEEGEQVPLKKLIQGLMINSGNDAGVAIAEHLSGSVENFASDLNKYLKETVGVDHTNFENPHGLFDSKHVTTAKDIAEITKYAMKNKLFKDINQMEEMEWIGESWETTIHNHHKLMGEIPYDGITGGKTGYVRQSGFTLATTAKREYLSVIVVTLNAQLQEDAYTDTINLLDYAFDNYQTAFISAGTHYNVGEDVYKVPDDLYYTHKVDNEVNEQIEEDGILEATDEGTDQVIKSFQLEMVENDDKSVATSAASTDDMERQKVSFFQHYLAEIVLVILLSVGCVGIYYRKNIVNLLTNFR
ncbi:D-alanyl-D-alanine carboxypeptidase family protein [Oceanobacillus limi]|uniref:D-alanyl-D-alanine carboxypeptidase family protein n=1 Tax=Oceanobacillus limi TaxID=930131 RepID=UPI000B84C75A|nr:D-alanyl-D-alanine carboxypeptidase family protein [Oceanobacillus limi]